MRFLITGATGFIGQTLAKKLIERGHEVMALVRKTSKRAPLEKLGVRFTFGDLMSGDGLDEAVKDVDGVFHLAGMTKARTAEELYRCNSEGTRKLAEAISKHQPSAKLVYCSSLSAAGPTVAGRPRREEEQPAPISDYGRSKLAGELAVRELSDRVPSVIVRPPIVYGPADHEFLPSVLPMAKLGLILKSGLGPKHYSLVHVDDLCEGLIAAFERGSPVVPTVPGSGLYYVDDGREYSWEDICQILAHAVGRSKVFILPLPNAVGTLAGVGSELGAKMVGKVATLNRDKAREMACEAWTCSSARARKELSFEPTVPLEQGIAKTLAWYKEAGWL